jgi:Tfp pilus assembly protein PilN
MIQLNLLPDVKLDYIKAQRSRRLVVSVSVLVTALAVALLVLVFVIGLAQKKHLNDLNHDISSETTTLKQEPQISKILTVQNQLESLTALHAGKPAVSRLFTSYLNAITPASVSISTFNSDFTQQTATITGTADSLASVNQYVDTLKFTKYDTGANTPKSSAFNSVVLSSFGLNSSTKDPTQAASFTITLAYDKAIFDITQKNMQLSVPSQVTTRSALEQPTALFRAAPSVTTTPATGASSGGGGN